MVSKSDNSLKAHWFAAGLASALARFIPLPFAEGIVDERAKRYAIARTLSSHGRTFEEGKVSILYGGVSSISNWLVKKAFEIPLKLLLFPLKKLRRVATAVTGVPKDFTHTFLLARAVDKSLEAGLLKNSDTEEFLEETAKQIRECFDASYSQLDDIIISSTGKVIKSELADLKPYMSEAMLKILGKNLSKKKFQKEAVAMSKACKESIGSDDPKEGLDGISVQALMSQFDTYFNRKMKEASDVYKVV
ncbi:hypothetical protein N9D31_03560 [Oligoflexaceae bacterium]|nr:hypothetical protein [Oligoflexaceae bacterium]